MNSKHTMLALQAWFTWSLMFVTLCAQEPRIGGEARLEAWKRHHQMASSSPFTNLKWLTMGPKFAGGRIESIDAPRNDKKTIYAGVGAGGIWKTVNGGLTWKPIFNRESTFAIGDLAVASSDPNTIWVGTGECHLSGTSYSGTGVFKSSDAGETWTNMGLHESTHIGTVAIDPIDKNVVYVAAMGRKGGGRERGIYKTTNGGKTFKRVLSADSVRCIHVLSNPVLIWHSRVASHFVPPFERLALPLRLGASVFGSQFANFAFTAANSGLSATLVHSFG